MVKVKIKCIRCQIEEVVKMGCQKNCNPRYMCKNCGETFQVYHLNNDAKSETKNNYHNVD